MQKYNFDASAMIMASDTVQLGKLNIITELGCHIGSSSDCQIQIREENVRPRHVLVQYRTLKNQENEEENFFEITFNSFALYNGQLKPATVSFKNFKIV